MLKKILKIVICLSFIFFANNVLSQEDKIGEIAINTFRTHVRLPQGTEIKFLERKEGPIADFYSVKLLLIFPDREVPVVVYVDKAAEKVIIGNIFVKGENITAKEAGPHRLKKIDMAILDIEKSPSLGPIGAKVMMVEFSNFQCPHCMDSWAKLKVLLEKHPKEIRYIFKHFPFQPTGKTFELSEMAAAAQEVNQEAFWLVHDFLFTNEGQSIAQMDRNTIQLKIEQILGEKNLDVEGFKKALQNGKGKQRVLEDMGLGRKIRITSTPTKIVNGDLLLGSKVDYILEKYLTK